MPRLSDTKIRSSKPRAKPFKLYGTDGLFLIVNPNGSKCWRQRYRFAGGEQLLSLDAITLADARDRSAEFRKLVAKGADPSAHRKEKTAALIDATADTLKAVAIAWHEKFKPQWSAHHAHRVLQRIEDNVLPWLGANAIREVTSAGILACVDRMAKRGAYDTARRVLQILKKIFKWAACPAFRGKFGRNSPITTFDFLQTADHLRLQSQISRIPSTKMDHPKRPSAAAAWDTAIGTLAGLSDLVALNFGRLC
jgi:hypothetical protein